MIALAERFPRIRCIVQDLAKVVTGCQSSVPAHLQDRVSFMAHDFFLKQPVNGADVYFLRCILHD